MNFYDVLAAEKWDGGIPTMNFFDLLFAQSISGEKWEIYEGTLPATLNVNGSDLRQYQVWGNTGGVGDKTENLCKINGFSSSTTEQKLLQAIILNAGTYTFSCVQKDALTSNTRNCLMIRIGQAAYIYESTQKNYHLSAGKHTMTFTVSNDNVSVELRYWINEFSNICAFDNFMLTEGTTAPASFVPFGYEVDISTSDGTSNTTTPIYIGDELLEKDEYIDYQVGKVFRRTVNLFDKDVALDGYEIVNNGLKRNAYWCVSDFIPVEGNTLYKSVHSGGAALSYTDKSSQPTRLVGALNVNGVMTLSETKFIKLNCQISQKASCIVAKSDDFPETYIPYLQPTDPPVPLPALPTCEGTTVIDYAGQSVAPKKVVLEYAKGGN